MNKQITGCISIFGRLSRSCRLCRLLIHGCRQHLSMLFSHLDQSQSLRFIMMIINFKCCGLQVQRVEDWGQNSSCTKMAFFCHDIVAVTEQCMDRIDIDDVSICTKHMHQLMDMTFTVYHDQQSKAVWGPAKFNLTEVASNGPQPCKCINWLCRSSTRKITVKCINSISSCQVIIH